jgi:hypothetical protein
MFRYRSYHTTITIAVIIILLCLVSIVGVTLALFTNDIEDGTIGINSTAGKLKVDIVDTSAEKKSIVGETLAFVVDGQELEGDGTQVLFEPGKFVYTEGFRVENEGNIDMKYIIYITTDNKMKENKFDEAFEVWITTTKPHNRETPDNIEELQNFSGELEADALSETYYLVIKMKESAGNEFRNKEFGGIGITVCAVQGNVNITDQ